MSENGLTNGMTIGTTMRLTLTFKDIPTHEPTEQEVAAGFIPATTTDAVREFAEGFLELLQDEIIEPFKADFGDNIELSAGVEVEAFWLEGDEDRAAASVVLDGSSPE